VFLGIGLLYLTWTPSERWKEQRTTFKSFPILTIFWIMSLLYVIAAPFIPNTLPPAVPFYVVPTLGTSLLAIGTAYWVFWAKMLPMFGFHIQHEIEQLPDGSERVRYIVSLKCNPIDQQTPC
jgi:phosphatidylinositol 4-kinase